MAAAPKKAGHKYAGHEEISWQCSADFLPFILPCPAILASDPMGSSQCFT